MSRYMKNIAIMEQTKCVIRESGVISNNEAILCAEIDRLREGLQDIVNLPGERQDEGCNIAMGALDFNG